MFTVFFLTDFQLPEVVYRGRESQSQVGKTISK